MEKIYRKIVQIDARYKVAFISTIIAGLLIHMYAFTNQVQNHDYYGNVHIDQFYWPLSLGRCFLWPFTTISSYFSLTWVLGILSITYLAIAMCVLVKLFDIRNKIAIVLVAALVVSHPSLTDLFGYLFTCDGYCAGFLFAVLAVYYWTKQDGKKGLLCGTGFAILSIGIYQADLSIILYLGAIRIIMTMLLESHIEWKRFILKVISRMVLLIGSFVIYYLILHMIQGIAQTQMSDYAGFSTASLPTISYFIEVLRKDFVEFIFKFVGNDLNFTAYEVLNVVFAIFLIGLVVYFFVQQSQGRIKRIAITFLTLIVMIYSTSIFEFASADVYYRWEMMMCVSLWYVLFVILLEKTNRNSVQIGGVIVSVAIIINFSLIANITYQNQELAYQRTYAQCLLIADKITDLERFSPETPVLICGEYQSEDRDWMIGRLPERMTVDVDFMDQFYKVLSTNYGMTLKQMESDTMEKFSAAHSEIIDNMTCWPSKGSVEMVEGIAVVKLSESTDTE